MRALALRGFCISVGQYAEAGQEVDLTPAFFAEMQRLGAVEPAPEKAPPQERASDSPPPKRAKGA